MNRDHRTEGTKPGGEDKAFGGRSGREHAMNDWAGVGRFDWSKDMETRTVTKEQILSQLRRLEPAQWGEVLDFIGYLKHREAQKGEQPQGSELTARDLVQSGLVGIWADRDDIEDSVAFARQLRRQAETR